MQTDVRSTTVLALWLVALCSPALAGPTSSQASFFGSSSGIGIIEDSAEKNTGFLVYTSDNNYAISCPHLAHLGWDSISVNDQQVFLVTKDKKAITTPLNTLGFKNLATLDYVKSEFLLNLAGLVIDYPNRLTGSYKVLYTAEGKYQGTILPNGQLASPSTTAGAAGGLNGVNGFDGTGNYASGPSLGGSYGSSYSSPAGSSSYAAAKDYSSSAASNSYASAKDYSPSAGSSSYGTTKDYSSSAGSSSYATTKDYSNVEILEKEGNKVRHCNNQISNFYNTRGPLNASRSGDVYFFDYCGHAIDIYSDTVSTSNRPIGTAIYRDANYFSVYAPLVSPTINRVFLVEKTVFIVYNDGSVFVKPVQFLEPGEVELVVSARNYIQKIQQFKAEAVLVSKKLGNSHVDINFLKDKAAIFHTDELVKGKPAALETTKVSVGTDQDIGSLPVFARSIKAEGMMARVNGSTNTGFNARFLSEPLSMADYGA